MDGARPLAEIAGARHLSCVTWSVHPRIKEVQGLAYEVGFFTRPEDALVPGDIRAGMGVDLADGPAASRRPSVRRCRLSSPKLSDNADQPVSRSDGGGGVETMISRR